MNNKLVSDLTHCFLMQKTADEAYDDVCAIFKNNLNNMTLTTMMTSRNCFI
ncbi:MAG: hypothetical protein K2J83_00580 [Clostridia bacterium]|nr:hypothetical protein [Clostridia bacterium]